MTTIMCDRLWVNARLATMAPDSPYGAILDGAIGTLGSKIVWVGREKDLPESIRKEAREVIDANRAWITPGLIDCHTHLVYAGNRADEFAKRLCGETYEAIARAGGGILSTIRKTREASDQHLIESAASRLMPFMAEGVTTVEIKSGYGLNCETELRILRAARALGPLMDVDVRTTFLGLHALPPEFKNDQESYVRLVCEEMLPAAADEGLIDAVDAFCEQIGFTLQETGQLFEAATLLGLPVKLHADQLSAGGGAGIVARFAGLSADHLEWTSVDDVNAMAAAGTVAVLLPGAFYFLGETRIPPVDALRTAGVPMAVASDSNPGTAPVRSLLLMVNMACVLFRLTPEEALAGVTRQAARALGLDDRGVLEVGKRADLVLWNIDDPAELAYSIGSRSAVQIVRGGKDRHITCFLT